MINIMHVSALATTIIIERERENAIKDGIQEYQNIIS